MGKLAGDPLSAALVLREDGIIAAWGCMTASRSVLQLFRQRTRAPTACVQTVRGDEARDILALVASRGV